MAGKTLSRIDLSNAIVRNVGLSRNESSKIVDNIFDLMAQSLESGEPVKISSFGVFNLRNKTERIGRNPKTGEIAPVKPRRVISFRASHRLRMRVQTGGRH